MKLHNEDGMYGEDKLTPSWNAEAFLKEYRSIIEKIGRGDKQAYYTLKLLRTGVFVNTVQLVKRGYYIAENGMRFDFPRDDDRLHEPTFYSTEINVGDYPENSKPTAIEVRDMDCLYAGARLKSEGYNPAVLNMANRSTPGGGVANGAGAQEETLFRRTDLFSELFRFVPFGKDYGLRLMPQQYPLERNFGGIYVPDVIYFRDSEQNGYALLDEPVTMSVITVAGLNRPSVGADGMIVGHQAETVKNKIRTILRIGLVHGHDSLVLGALGCGAFCNPPRHVAMLFHEVINEAEFKNKYRRLLFAILDDHNTHKHHNPEGNFRPFYEEFERYQRLL